MGVVLDYYVTEKAKKSKLRFLILNYMIQKKSSEAQGEKYLRSKVPKQFWYQVQKEAKDRYGV